MNNKQIFYLRSPLQQNLILHKSCFYTAIIMQDRMAMQWQQKVPKERKISKSNVILEESTEKFKNIQKKTKIIQAQQMSIWDIWQKMLMVSRELLSKYPLHLALGQTCDLTPISVAQFALEIQLYCKKEEDPWGNPIILQVGTLMDLNWLNMQIMGIIVVTVLWEEWATTPRPVLNAPEWW